MIYNKNYNRFIIVPESRDVENKPFTETIFPFVVKVPVELVPPFTLAFTLIPLNPVSAENNIYMTPPFGTLY